MAELVTSVLLPAIVLVAYGSLAVELTVLPVPSIASTLKIWSPPSEVEAAYSAPYREVLQLSRPKKILFLVAPLLAIYGVYLYPLIAILARTDPLGDQAFASTATTDVLATLLIVAGRGVTLGSVMAMRSDRNGVAAAGSLRTDGFFRFSRNPGLVGMYAFVAGLWLAAPSITMLAGVLIYMLHMDFKVRMEEDYLERRFGDSYRAYRKRTNRYLP